MRVRAWLLNWILAASSLPCLFAAGPAGEPDPNAFRNWRSTLDSRSVISSVAYGQGKWVGAGTHVSYSTNGVDWRPTGWGGEPNHFWKVIYADGGFVAVGEHYPFPLLASTNGINFIGLVFSEFGRPRFWDVAYGNGVFVAGGDRSPSFFIATNPPSRWSTLGQWWWPVAQEFPCHGVFFGAGKFVAAGPGPATAVSTNGRDWVVTPHPWLPNGILRGGVWHNDRYIVVGSGGIILVSEDAVNWTQRPTPTSRELWQVAAHDNQYVAVGPNIMLISTNGLDWEDLPLLDPQSYLTDVSVADHTFAAPYYIPGGPSAVYQSDPFNCAAPLFLKHPAHTEQRIGLATNLSAWAEGTSPLTYQWQKNGVDIPGATSNGLAFANLQRSDDAKYRVIAHNGLGEVTSAEAKLTVGLPVSVLVSPVSQSAPAGGSVTFSVGFEGTPPITNKWRKPDSTFVTQVLNQPTAFLRVENLQAANAGTYSAALGNKYGIAASGPATLTVLADADADGLPDDWETQYGLQNPAGDPDGDGLTNLQEYQSGTNPKDPQSFLKVDRIEAAEGSAAVILSFIARSNQTYSVQSREHLAAGTWQRVLDVAASGSDRLMAVTNPVVSTETYFRLVTPRAE